MGAIRIREIRLKNFAVRKVNLIYSKNGISYLVLILFWIFGLNIVLGQEAVLFPDSGGYLLKSTTDGWSNFSFMGNSTRAWPTMLVYSLVDTHNARIILQTIIYLFALTFLILTTSLVAKGWRNLLGLVLVICICLSDNFFQWNLAILSESTTLSFIVLGLSFFRLSFYSKKSNLLFFVISQIFLLLASLVRPQLLVVVFVCFVIWLNRYFTLKNLLRTPLLMLLIFIYVIILNSNISNFWATGGAGTTNKDAISFYFLTSTDTRNDRLTNRLFEAIPSQAPRCLREENNRASFIEPPGPYAFQGNQYLNCPTGVNWANNEFLGFYIRFLVLNPIHVVETAIHYFPGSLYDSKYANPDTVVPYYIESLWTVRGTSFIQGLKLIPWILIPILSLMFRLKNRSRFKRKEFFDVNFALYVGFFCSQLITHLLMNAESTRISYTSMLPAMILAVLYLVSNDKERLEKYT